MELISLADLHDRGRRDHQEVGAKRARATGLVHGGSEAARGHVSHHFDSTSRSRCDSPKRGVAFLCGQAETLARETKTNRSDSAPRPEVDLPIQPLPADVTPPLQ